MGRPRRQLRHSDVPVIISFAASDIEAAAPVTFPASMGSVISRVGAVLCVYRHSYLLQSINVIDQKCYQITCSGKSVYMLAIRDGANLSFEAMEDLRERQADFESILLLPHVYVQLWTSRCVF